MFSFNTAKAYARHVGIKYVGRNTPAPASFKTRATCGTCGRTWDDSISTSTSVTPAPSARCPFEYYH